MTTTLYEIPQPSTPGTATHGDHPEPGSSFGSQAQTLVQSLIPSMADKEVPTTGDERISLPSTRPPVPHGPKVSKFVVYMRKIYRPLGFHKGYNFPLCERPPSLVHVAVLIKASHRLRRRHARIHARQTIESECQRLVARKFQIRCSAWRMVLSLARPLPLWSHAASGHRPSSWLAHGLAICSIYSKEILHIPSNQRIRSCYLNRVEQCWRSDDC